MVKQNKFVSLFFALLAINTLLCFAAHAQVNSTASGTQFLPRDQPSITPSPAIIMVKAKPGQIFSQELTLYNNTISELGFSLEAVDVVIRDGKRVFIPAGEIAGSIARNTVFTNSTVFVKPGSSGSSTVTVTLPEAPGTRAIACIFMGKNVMGSQGSLNMTGSVGALVTFTLSDDFHVSSEPIRVVVDQDSPSIVFHQMLKNVGSDPVIPTGVIAITDENGSLVVRLPMPPHRLLPGESHEITAEYPSSLKSGKYRVNFLMENQSEFFSNAAEFSVK